MCAMHADQRISKPQPRSQPRSHGSLQRRWHAGGDASLGAGPQARGRSDLGAGDRPPQVTVCAASLLIGSVCQRFVVRLGQHRWAGAAQRMPACKPRSTCHGSEDAQVKLMIVEAERMMWRCLMQTHMLHATWQRITDRSSVAQCFDRHLAGRVGDAVHHPAAGRGAGVPPVLRGLCARRVPCGRRLPDVRLCHVKLDPR